MCFSQGHRESQRKMLATDCCYLVFIVEWPSYICLVQHGVNTFSTELFAMQGAANAFMCGMLYGFPERNLTQEQRPGKAALNFQ